MEVVGLCVTRNEAITHAFSAQIAQKEWLSPIKEIFNVDRLVIDPNSDGDEGRREESGLAGPRSTLEAASTPRLNSNQKQNNMHRGEYR